MVAATVLMVGVTGTIITNASASSLVRTSEETQLVTVALAEAAERMRLLVPDDVPATYPDGAAMPAQDVGLRGFQIVPTYPAYTPGDGVITIRLSATWTTFDGASRTLELTTAV